MQPKIGFFEESVNNKSMMRLKVFIALLAAVFLAIAQEIAVFYFELISTPENPKQFTREFTVILGLLGYAGGTKVIQTKYEKNSNNLGGNP